MIKSLTNAGFGYVITDFTIEQCGGSSIAKLVIVLAKGLYAFLVLSLLCEVADKRFIVPEYLKIDI